MLSPEREQSLGALSIHARRVLVIGAVVAAIVGVAYPASAIPTHPEDLHDSCGRIVETAYGDPLNEFPWTTEAKAAFKDSANDWQVAKSFDGEKVDIRFNSSNPEILVFFDDLLLLQGADGEGTCVPGSTGSLALNPFTMIDDDGLPIGDLWPVVPGHEMGHVLGLGHTGDSASHDGDNPPLMSTCHGDIESNSYSQDDEAALLHVKEWISPPPLHANPGYERGTEYWGKTGGTWEVKGTNNADGDKHIRWNPTSESQYVYQTVDLSTRNVVEVADTIDARVNHRLQTSTHGGDVKLEIRVRQLEFAGTAALECFASEKDENRRYTSTTWVLVATTGWVTVDSDWDWDTTPEYTVPSLWEGAEVQVRVKSRVRKSGGTGALIWVHLDTVRARQK